MESSEQRALQAFAVRIRMALVEAIHSIGSGHVGGALSIADVLAVLYGREMNVRPEDPQWPDRDYLVVSKGHAGPAVYGTLALKGYFPYEELKTLNQGGTRLPSHCDRPRHRRDHRLSRPGHLPGRGPGSRQPAQGPEEPGVPHRGRR